MPVPDPWYGNDTGVVVADVVEPGVDVVVIVVDFGEQVQEADMIMANTINPITRQ